MTASPQPEHAVRVDIPVAFYHCDPLGVVWHGRYFEYFETARMALLASCGLDVAHIRDLGYRLFITDARCKYMAPLSLGDAPQLSAWFETVTPLIRINYEIRVPAPGAMPGSTQDTTQDSKLCSRATTLIAATDADGTLQAETPDALLKRLPVL
ncbi:MAG: acyl-CoA thioesterase [Planctomycetota bacterium]